MPFHYFHFSVAISAANELGFGTVAVSTGRTQSIGRYFLCQ